MKNGDIFLKSQTPTFTPKEARPQFKTSKTPYILKNLKTCIYFPFYSLSGCIGADTAIAEDGETLSVDTMGISWIPCAGKGKKVVSFILGLILS